LAKIPGVKRVWPVERYQLPKPKLSKEDPTNPLLTSAHEMTGVDFAQKTFKYTGKGYKIGIIDSGVDYSHPALGGCFGKGCRVVVGHDFVGDDYDKTGVPVEDEGNNCDFKMTIESDRITILRPCLPNGLILLCAFSKQIPLITAMVTVPTLLVLSVLTPGMSRTLLRSLSVLPLMCNSVPTESSLALDLVLPISS